MYLSGVCVCVYGWGTGGVRLVTHDMTDSTILRGERTCELRLNVAASCNAIPLLFVSGLGLGPSTPLCWIGMQWHRVYSITLSRHRMDGPARGEGMSRHPTWAPTSDSSLNCRLFLAGLHVVKCGLKRPFFP